MPYTVTDIQRIVDAQRAFFRTGQTLDIKWRLARLKHFSGLMCFPSLTTKVYKMPYGVTLVISPFNFPVLLTLGVLAKAADNLTPVALELGGETGNWCIVRKDADIVRKELFCPLLPVVPFRDGRISRRVGFPRIHSCIDCPEGKHPLQSFYAGASV